MELKSTFTFMRLVDAFIQNNLYGIQAGMREGRKVNGICKLDTSHLLYGFKPDNDY